MFIRTVEERYVHGRWGTTQVRQRDVFKCDECGNEYTLGHKASHALNGAMSFCSRACNKSSRSTGKLAERWKKTRLQRYGVEHPSQVAGAAKKMIRTRTARTGAAGPADPRSTSNVAFRSTMLERHGAEHPSLSPAVRERKVVTYRQRYGVANPWSAGSRFRNRDDHVKGGQLGYRALVLKLGREVLSRPEAAMHQWLIERFGQENVDQQVVIEYGGKKPWLIDFYVRTLDTYVQVDGVFWHGLGRPYNELHTHVRGVYDRDRLQDEWFAVNGKKLVRVTDQALYECQRRQDYSAILLKLGG